MTPVFAKPGPGERSFERLYRRHAADVYRYAYAVLHNRADAEDVTQTTFMNAYRALERGERPQRPQNWLIAIAHNVCRQRFRQSQRRPAEVAWQDDLPEQLVADDEGPSVEDVRRALGHLAFNQRAALVMRELEGRSYAEIGEVLELSTSAVETLIFRARRALREQLEGHLTCGEAERAISRRLDGRLSRAEKGQLRAHLRECGECATFARRQRAQRAALKSLGAIPLPASLASLFGGGGGTAAVVAAKAATAVAAAALAGGAGYEAARSTQHRHAPQSLARPALNDAAATTPSAADGAPHAPAAPVRHEIAAPRHVGTTGHPHGAGSHGHRRGAARAPGPAGSMPAHGTRGVGNGSAAPPAAAVAAAHPAPPAQRAVHAQQPPHVPAAKRRQAAKPSRATRSPAPPQQRQGTSGSHGNPHGPPAASAAPSSSPAKHGDPPGPPPGAHGASFSP